MKSFEVQVRAFGAWRKYEQLAPRSLHFHAPITVSEFKTALGKEYRQRVADFSEEQLLEDSAIADHRQVLSSTHLIQDNCELLVLPPVCGG